LTGYTFLYKGVKWHVIVVNDNKICDIFRNYNVIFRDQVQQNKKNLISIFTVHHVYLAVIS